MMTYILIINFAAQTSTQRRWFSVVPPRQSSARIKKKPLSNLTLRARSPDTPFDNPCAKKEAPEWCGEGYTVSDTQTQSAPWYHPVDMIVVRVASRVILTASM